MFGFSTRFRRRMSAGTSYARWVLVAVGSVATSLGPMSSQNAEAAAGITTRISVDSSDGHGNGWSARSSISADGRYVAFASGASNLVVGDSNNMADVFVYHTQTGTTSRLSEPERDGRIRPTAGSDPLPTKTRRSRESGRREPFP